MHTNVPEGRLLILYSAHHQHWLTHGVPTDALELSEKEATFAKTIDKQFRNTEGSAQLVFSIADAVRTQCSSLHTLPSIFSQITKTMPSQRQMMTYMNIINVKIC